MAEAVRSQQDLQTNELAALAGAVSRLAGQLRRRAAVSGDFLHLLDQARALAMQAWDMRTSRWGFQENAAKLAEALLRFTADATADRTRGTATDDELTAALNAHAGRLGALAHGRPAVAIRAELEPLEAALRRLQAQLAEERVVRADASALTREAARLGERALGLRTGGRAAEQALSDIHRALTAFVEDGSPVAERMAQATARLNEEAAQMALLRRGPGKAPPHPRQTEQ